MKYTHKALLGPALIINSIILSGCFHDNNEESLTPSDYYAAVSTSDYTNSDVSIISLSDYSIINDTFDTQADITISTNKSSLYVIGRLGTDSITKFEVESIKTENESGDENTSDTNDITETTVTNKWQYSVGAKTNPYTLVQKDDSTAYVIRYASDKILIINPNAENEADFQIGELDLSPYNNADDSPEASGAVLVGNKLFVKLEQWDQSNGYPWTLNDAYVAVFDTTTNLEIETNNDSNTPKGIKLLTKNPQKMVYESVGKKLYIASRGSYAPDYSGGIETINTSTFENTLLLDDGDSSDNYPYGAITNIAILSPSRGYFVGSASYQNDAVYSFNPTTKVVDTTPLMQNSSITDVEIGPRGNLWVADRVKMGIIVFDTVDNSVLEALITPDLPPTNIEFIAVPQEN